MATAVGDIVVDFSGLADANPYTNADFTNLTANSAAIVSGVFTNAVADAEAVFRYSAAEPSGSIIRSEVEISYEGAQGADSRTGPAILDASYNGYTFRYAGGTSTFLRGVTGGSIVEFYTSPSASFVPGDRLAMEYEPGTGRLEIFKNDVSIASDTATLHTTGLGAAIYAGGTSTTKGVFSFAATGYSVAPTITDINTNNEVVPGTTATLTGTGFGATQGTGGLTIGGVSQTITSWSDTEIIFTAVLGTNNYGTGKTLEVTTDAATTVSDTIELVADTANGFGYVEMVNPANSDESSVTFGTTPAVAAPDQFEWEDFNNLGNLTIDAQGFVTNVDTEGTFRGRFWDATDSTWGAVETFTAEVPDEVDAWPFGKGISYAAPKTWTWGGRHPKTGMRVRIFK